MLCTIKIIGMAEVVGAWKPLSEAARKDYEERKARLDEKIKGTEREGKLIPVYRVVPTFPTRDHPDVEKWTVYEIEACRRVELPAPPIKGIAVYLKDGHIPQDFERTVTMTEDEEGCEVFLEIPRFTVWQEDRDDFLPQILGERPSELASQEWFEAIIELGSCVSRGGWEVKARK